MAVWSTRRPGDPASIAHRMTPDAFGRPTDPVCGRSVVGLWFRRDFSWEQVPPAQRCAECDAWSPAGT